MIRIRIFPSADGHYQGEIEDGGDVIPAIPLNTPLEIRDLFRLDYAAAQLYGGKLLNFLLPAAQRKIYDRSLKDAVSASSSAELILELDSKELEVVPWELAYDPVLEKFLCLSKYTPIVRYIPFPLNSPTPSDSTKPKALVILSSPLELSNLNLLHEKKWLRNAFAPFERQGVVDVQYLENPVFEQVQELLESEKFQMIHFSGHAGFDREHNQGYLVFEDEAGKGRKIYASTTENLFAANEIRFVFLNACKTSSRSDHYGSMSIAHSCIRAGARWVVGMQQPISDSVAATFSKAFYTTLLSRFNIIDAMTSGRQNVQNQDAGFTSEWATPVLISSSTREFQLFNQVLPKDQQPSGASPGPSTQELDFSARLDSIKIESMKIRSTTHLKMWLANEERRAMHGPDVPINITREIEFHKSKFMEIQVLLGRLALSDEYKSLIFASLNKRLELRTRSLEKLREIEAQRVEGIMQQVELRQAIEFQEEECSALEREIANYSPSR